VVLNNVTGGENDVLFDLTHATITWKITDDAGNLVEPTARAGKRSMEPMQQKVLDKSGGTLRLPLSQSDENAPDTRHGYLTLAPGLAWTFDGEANKIYFLTGKINIPFVSEHAWYGTMELPAVALPTD
jgi:hypothetical protein